MLKNKKKHNHLFLPLGLGAKKYKWLTLQLLVPELLVYAVPIIYTKAVTM